MNRVKANFYPMNYVLPTGDLFNFCGRYGYIMQPGTGACVCVVDTRQVKAPVSPHPDMLPCVDLSRMHAPWLAGKYLLEIPKRYGYASAQSPFTGTAVMLPLWPERGYKFEVCRGRIRSSVPRAAVLQEVSAAAPS